MRDQPALTGVVQVGIVVADAEATAKRFADCYGIGPWGFYELNESNSRDTMVSGRRVDVRAKFALAYVGSMQFELCEPLDDNSIYAEYLAEHGPGLHHLAFSTPDGPEALSLFRANGHGERASGGFLDFTYHYLDTQEELGLCVEILCGLEEGRFYEPLTTYPPGSDFEAAVRRATG
jgi:hypothetical protein